MTTQRPRAASGQSVGERERQEDAVGFRHLGNAGECLALVLGDGMGGHAGGDIASATCVSTVLDHLEKSTAPERSLRPAVEEANAAIARAAQRDESLEGMGTTVIGAVIKSDRLSWVSVGDSPLFLIRDGDIRQLNADHSMRPVLADMVKSGRLSEEEAARDPNRNALRSAVFGEKINLIDESPTELILQEGDIVLLCSDGIDTLETSEILQASEVAAPDAQAISDGLLEAVAGKGRRRQDNTSIVAYVHTASGSAADRGAARSAPRTLFWLISATGVVLLLILAGYFVFAPGMTGSNSEGAGNISDVPAAEDGAETEAESDLLNVPDNDGQNADAADAGTESPGLEGSDAEQPAGDQQGP